MNQKSKKLCLDYLAKNYNFWPEIHSTWHTSATHFGYKWTQLPSGNWILKNDNDFISEFMFNKHIKNSKLEEDQTKIEYYKEILKKNRVFEEDLPKELKILCDCIQKHPAEYALKFSIIEIELNSLLQKEID